MLPKGTPGWVYEARRNRLLLEQVAYDLGSNHVTHRRGGNRKTSGWRLPVSPPYIPYPVGYDKRGTQK